MVMLLRPEELFKGERITRKINAVVLHYTAVAGKKTAEEVKKQIEAIRREHKERGWKDIGYHIGIDLLGRYWKLRPINEIGAHSRGYNKNSIGVVMFADAEQLQSAPLLEDAVLRLFGYLAIRFRNPAFFLHRQLNPTQCPPIRKEFEQRLRTLGYLSGGDGDGT
jgi:N-acetylmuramoyl-L-alanine amidase